ncbi:MAG: hypothetical protein F6J97_17380 [Leptolyngbya sp. SIO4C1]|nr:hypothetical protein [Leptolyngbya sp. SIO4C1]
MRKIFLMGLAAILSALLLANWPQPAMAHDPHDVVQQIELSPDYAQDQTLFLLVRGSFLKSTDGGQHWRRQVRGLTHRGALTAFALSPQSPEQLYLVANGDGVYRSDDAGETWQPAAQGLAETALTQIATARDRVFVAGESGQLYRSVDGAPWSVAYTAAAPISAMAVSPDQPEQVLLGDRDGRIYQPAHSGQTWLSAATLDSPITQIAFPRDAADAQTVYVGTASAGVFRSRDGGQTFSAVNQGLSDLNVQDIAAVDERDRVRLYAATATEGVFYSDDGGDRWQPLSLGLTRTDQADRMGHPHFTQLSLSPAFEQDGVLFVSGFNGLFKTADRGQSWTEVSTLPVNIVIGLALSPSYGDDQTLAVVNYVGEAYLSQDAGATWEPMAQGLAQPYFTGRLAAVDPNEDERRFQDVAFSPSYPTDQTIFATLLQNGVLRYQQGRWRLHRLQQWERALTLVPSPSYASDRTLFLGTQKGRIYRSTDGGRSYDPVGQIEAQAGNESPYLVISPNFAADQTLYMTGPAGVYQTTDAGQTWQPVTDAAQFQTKGSFRLAISPDYAQDQMLLLATSAGLYQTVDAGRSWQAVTGLAAEAAPYVEAVAISPNYAVDQTFFVSLRGQGLMKTTDRGQTFEPVGDATLPFAIVTNFEAATMPLVISPSFATDQTLYGLGAVSSEIFRSTDVGVTWETLPLPNSPIFEAYRQRQYGPLMRAQLWLHVYRSRLLKWGIAAIAALASYGLLSYLPLEKRLPLSRRQIKLGGTVAVFAIALAVLLYG